jgi:hypothetical protein
MEELKVLEKYQPIKSLFWGPELFKESSLSMTVVFRRYLHKNKQEKQKDTEGKP